MSLSKTEVYKYIDENGIQVKFHASFAISFSVESQQLQSGPRKSYQIGPNPFGLTNEEFEIEIFDYLFDTVGIRVSSMYDIVSYRSIEGRPFVVPIFGDHSNYSVYSIAFGRIKGSLRIESDDMILNLGNIEQIDGDLTFKGSELRSLGKLRKVGGSIYVRQFDPPYTKLTTLGELEYVGGDCILKQSPIEDIGELKYVGGNLNLRSTDLSSIGKLEHVGGNLFLPKLMKGRCDLANVKVEGNVKYFST